MMVRMITAITKTGTITMTNVITMLLTTLTTKDYDQERAVAGVFRRPPISVTAHIHRFVHA